MPLPTGIIRLTNPYPPWLVSTGLSKAPAHDPARGLFFDFSGRLLGRLCWGLWAILPSALSNAASLLIGASLARCLYEEGALVLGLVGGFGSHRSTISDLPACREVRHA